MSGRLRAAREAIRAIGAMVVRTPHHDPAAIGEWHAAIRVGRKVGGRRAVAVALLAKANVVAAVVVQPEPEVRWLPGAAQGLLRAIAGRFARRPATVLARLLSG